MICNYTLIFEQEHNQGLALDYVNQAIKLGYEWRVDVDELRIKYVELLYLNQMDHLAYEVLPSIGSGEKLVPTMLEAARKGLKTTLKQSDISALSPMTTDWLNGFMPESESSVPFHCLKDPVQPLECIYSGFGRWF